MVKGTGQPSAGLLDYTAADFDRIFDPNVRGLFLRVREEVGQRIEH
jgi:NAD(P)-dependent dehydrogenase (short-subunit alcohol dehydrogenase family)